LKVATQNGDAPTRAGENDEEWHNPRMACANHNEQGIRFFQEIAIKTTKLVKRNYLPQPV